MAKSTDNDETGFMESLGGIRKLQFDRVDLHQQKPKPRARVSPSDRHSAYTNGVSADQDPVKESWFENGVSTKLQRRIKSGKVHIEASIDLHGLRQQQALTELTHFLDEALALQHRLLLVIHGKGTRSTSHAKLRPLVQRWLLNQPMVLGYCHAQPRDGGNGASYVLLKIQK